MCKYCGAGIIFDERILAKSGNPHALNLDNSIHRCFAIPTDTEGWVLAAIRMVAEINKKLTGCSLKVVRSEKE